MKLWKTENEGKENERTTMERITILDTIDDGTFKWKGQDGVIHDGHVDFQGNMVLSPEHRLFADGSGKKWKELPNLMLAKGEPTQLGSSHPVWSMEHVIDAANCFYFSGLTWKYTLEMEEQNAEEKKLDQVVVKSSRPNLKGEETNNPDMFKKEMFGLNYFEEGRQLISAYTAYDFVYMHFYQGEGENKHHLVLTGYNYLNLFGHKLYIGIQTGENCGLGFFCGLFKLAISQGECS